MKYKKQIQGNASVMTNKKKNLVVDDEGKWKAEKRNGSMVSHDRNSKYENDQD